MLISGPVLAALVLALAPDDGTMAADSAGGALAFSPDGRSLLTHGAAGLRLWDLATGLERKLEKNSGSPRPAPERHFGFSPDGKEIVLYEKGRFAAWDVEKGTRLRDVRGPAEAGPSSLLSPDGRSFAVGGTLYRTDRDESRRLDLPEGDVSSLAFSAAGDRIVLSGAKRGRGAWVAVRETATGRDLMTATIPPPDGSRSVVVNVAPGSLFADGKRLAVSRAKGTHVPGLPLGASSVLLWDVGSGRMIGGMEAHQGPVWGMTAARDGSRAATWGTADLIVWEGDPPKTIASRTGMIHAAALAPDASAVALIASPDEINHQERTLVVVDLATGKDRFTRPPARFQGVDFSPDGKVLAATSDKGILLLDFQSGDPVKAR